MIQTSSAGQLLDEIEAASRRLEGVAARTPLQLSKRLSLRYDARVYLKREDLQEVRSFKIRGAYNRVAALADAERKRGVACASAGNHAQGLAYACAALSIDGVIFMPAVTPLQKVDRVRHFGGDRVEVRLVGETFDEAGRAAERHCEDTGAFMIHPFDDPLTVAGQGTVAKEVDQELGGDLEFVIVPIGGGGLAAGIAAYLAGTRPGVQVVGAEPAGADSMRRSLVAGAVQSLESVDTFVDGAAVQRVGDLTFDICSRHLKTLLAVPEGQICTTMIELYQNDGIVAEPAGALSIAALDQIGDLIRGCTVACVLSGGNNDLLRYPEIMERSLVHQGRKHYLIVEFAQKPGQLRQFVDRCLGPTDDIVRFEYMKKTNKERGAALVGIELRDREDLDGLLERLDASQISYRLLESSDPLYGYLI